MSLHASVVKAGYEPIPGYKLKKRLGAGGYGEVWLADAPGGLEKAIKLIYGAADEAQASRELKSLRRVSQVYHPFLLSLERIEIVDDQVVIVTELAESSLQDRFEQSQRKGALGINRSILLDFLGDAADALDFLAQKHALQHLDVKPANLLIIADRIKVADFGLIKDLHDQTQSLVTGLTPTYSAPEIFDGRPDYRSDQYSLAITYMEMLTGRLPFNGRTTGELARQHLGQAPDLDALPPADRSIVARALSKNPIDRFTTSKQFVEQLLKVKHAVLPSFNRGSQPDSNSDTAEVAGSTLTPEHTKTSTSPALGRSIEFTASIDVGEKLSNWNTPRCVFIGLGGLGGKTLLDLRERMRDDCDNSLTADDHRWLAIDCDTKALDNLMSDETTGMPSRSVLQIPLEHPSAYRKADPSLFGCISRRWLYNIPRSLQTEGVRPLAVLSYLHHYARVRLSLANMLREIVDEIEAGEADAEPLRIYLISSLHGGTGSALLAEIGLLIGTLMKDMRHDNYQTFGFGSIATSINSQGANLAPAAAMATLSELTYLMSRDHLSSALHFEERMDGPLRHKPMAWMTLVDGGLHGNKDDVGSTIRALSQAIFLDSQTVCGRAMHDRRMADRQQPLGWLRSVKAGRVKLADSITPMDLARWCCAETLNNSSIYMSGRKDGTKDGSSAAVPTKTIAPTVSGDLPLTENACNDYARRLLIDLGAISVSHSANEHGRSQTAGEEGLSNWKARLFGDEQQVASQLANDLDAWKRSLRKIVRLRVYNWKQVEQLQLNVVERVLDYCENSADELAQLFGSFESTLGPTDSVCKLACDYLRDFAKVCFQEFQDFQTQGNELGRKLAAWCDSIAAEKTQTVRQGEINLLALPPRLQLLASRVNAVLESTVHRLSVQIVAEHDVDLHLNSDDSRSTQEVNLQYMLQLASELVSRISNELAITSEEFNFSSGNADDSTSIRGLYSFVPQMAQYGGLVTRVVMAPADQLTIVRPILEQRKIADRTTLLSTSPSLGPHVYSEMTRLSLPAIISHLWRPSPQTIHLAERLRTRVDIDWEPAAKLLEALELPNAEAHEEPPCGNSMNETDSADPTYVPTEEATQATPPPQEHSATEPV